MPEPEPLAQRARELRVAQREGSARTIESRIEVLQQWKEQLLADRVKPATIGMFDESNAAP